MVKRATGNGLEKFERTRNQIAEAMAAPTTKPNIAETRRSRFLRMVGAGVGMPAPDPARRSNAIPALHRVPFASDHPDLWQDNSLRHDRMPVAKAVEC